MTQTANQIVEAALALPAAEQLEVVEALIAELDAREALPFDEKWLKEIERRSAEYDAGGATSIPWEEVRARARHRGGDRA